MRFALRRATRQMTAGMMSILSRFFAICFFMIWNAVAATTHDDIRQTVKRYNDGIIIAGRTGKTDVLKPIATQKIVTKTHLWIMAWQDDNYYMDAKLLQLDFKSIKTDSNSSIVKTNEKWRYSYFDAANKKTALPEKEIDYDMQYTLYSHQGRWVISDVKVLSEKQKK